MDTTSCWDTGKIKKRLTPALSPADGSTPGKCGKVLYGIQLFRERLSYKRGKTNATMSKVIIGNGDFTVA